MDEIKKEHEFLADKTKRLRQEARELQEKVSQLNLGVLSTVMLIDAQISRLNDLNLEKK